VPDELHPRHLGRRVAQLALLAAVLALVVLALPGLSEVRARFARADPGWLALAAAAELASVLSYVVVFRGVFCRRMRWGLSYQIGMAEQAANSLLPAGGAGGLALGAWALRRGGMSTGHIGRRTVAFFIITSAANFIAVIAVGVGLAAGVLPGRASLALTLLPAAAAAATMLLVLALPGLLDRFVADPAALRARGGWGGRLLSALAGGARMVADGVREALALLRAGRSSAIFGSAGYLAFDIAALTLAFRSVGSAPAAGSLLLAYLLGQLGGLLPLPGGVGGVDAGLVGALILYGAPLAAAVAAVAIYRVLQLLLPAVLGSVAFVKLRSTLRREDAPAMCAPLGETLSTATC
jgi:uncharacterized membrane protein YbhN (UPF0104 family)